MKKKRTEKISRRKKKRLTLICSRHEVPFKVLWFPRNSLARSRAQTFMQHQHNRQHEDRFCQRKKKAHVSWINQSPIEDARSLQETHKHSTAAQFDSQLLVSITDEKKVRYLHIQIFFLLACLFNWKQKSIRRVALHNSLTVIEKADSVFCPNGFFGADQRNSVHHSTRHVRKKQIRLPARPEVADKR